MTEYVLGFAFDSTADNVILIRKTKPAWQAGRLNGIGGKIEPGETPTNAMVREFREETGIDTDPSQWVPRVIMQSDKVGECNSPLDPHGYRVYTYTCALYENQWKQMRTATEERVVTESPNALPRGCLQSVKWLVPFLLDRDMESIPYIIYYNK